eukprot:5833986-Pyramimonas_sp.AAC.1
MGANSSRRACRGERQRPAQRRPPKPLRPDRGIKNRRPSSPGEGAIAPGDADEPRGATVASSGG